ncbi:MAG: ROK family transcriptional regulator [Bifidobacteriaceae bacterium]|jgi:predicted NBD/HSP70 family sugar kinase|nr:ROK family transcriptional regulator [Bifidobacteriaceae bacterium]
MNGVDERDEAANPNKPQRNGSGVINGTGARANLRERNTRAVLHHLHSVGDASRADLARATGLSRATVSDIVTGLIDRGLVQEKEKPDGGRTGRPATPVSLDQTSYLVVALDLSDTRNVYGALTDLSGRVITRKADFIGTTRGATAIDRVAVLAAFLADKADRPVLGVGVASPGSIDLEGRFVAEAYYGWNGINLAQLLTERLGLTSYVANDANCAALAEAAFAGARGNYLLALVIGHGIGAGLVLEGRIVRGSNHAAGEIGHVVADETGLPCGCGRRGCLETMISLPVLERLAHDESGLAEAGWKTGTVLAPVIGALNIDEVVLVAPPELVEGPFIASLQGAITVHTLPALSRNLEVRTSSLGREATLAGACAVVVSNELGLF